LDGSSGFRGPRHFGGPHPFRLAPITAGQEYYVKIESMSRRGDSGVAKIQGLVVFVAGTQVGKHEKIRIIKVGSGFATAEIITEERHGGNGNNEDGSASNAASQSGELQPEVSADSFK
jgi:predicted RNA-binding protein with TRAM domain